MIITNKKERSRFLRFAVVGSIGAVIDFGVFNLLTSHFGVKAVISSMVSFTLAVFSNFLWNRFWTYPDSRSKPVQKQLMQFLVISLIGLGIRTPLFAWLEKWMTARFAAVSFNPPLTPTLVGHNLSLAIVIVVVMFWNFFANRFWTYSDIDAEEQKRCKMGVMKNDNRVLPVYTSRGDVGAFLLYPHLFNLNGEWVGFVTPDRKVYSVLGFYAGTLATPFRIVRKRSDDFDQPKITPPSRPERIFPPATVPLAPLLPELGFDTVDILSEEPERLHPVDSGSLREDIS